MTTTTLTKKISMERKIDMIFKFIFEQTNALKEEAFWNTLQKHEIDEINSIRKEKTEDFSMLKKKCIWKK